MPGHTSVRENHWYLKPGEPSEPPDRPAHLDRLDALLRFGQESNALEALWAVHYVTGAIALSCLMNGVVDWPTPVMRLSITAHVTSDGPELDERERVRVADWIQDNTGNDVAGHAITHFRAAADTLRTLSLTTAGPDSHLIVNPDDLTQQMIRYVADPEEPLEPLRTLPGSVLRAESLWWFVEPVYREWVLAAHYGNHPEARLIALCHARQFNALAATELWSELPAETWRACRDRIMTAYDSDLTMMDVQARLGPHTTLIDYYTY